MNAPSEQPFARAVTEGELDANASAPRVTDADVEAFIKTEHYFTAGEGAQGAEIPRHMLASYDAQLDLLTICVLVLANGFTVHGVSACASPMNFDPAIGQRLARQDAKNKVWGLLGFELRSRLALVEASRAPSMSGMTTHVGTKVVHAVPMTRGRYCEARGWSVPADENPSDEGYFIEYADGGKPNMADFAGYVSWSPADVFERAYGSPLART